MGCDGKIVLLVNILFVHEKGKKIMDVPRNATVYTTRDTKIFVGRQKINPQTLFTVTPEKDGPMVQVRANNWKASERVHRNVIDTLLVVDRSIEVPAYAG